MADGLIFRGAEAEVRRTTAFGLPAVAKRRVAKPYRHPELDARIRRERTRAEAGITAEARAAGVRVPRVLDVDLPEATIRFEFVEGPTLRDRIEAGAAEEAVRAFGGLVGRLHAAGLVHGDLTTSNVLVGAQGPTLVDFGLARRSEEVEDRGVDLQLVMRTFAASHPRSPGLAAVFLAGYQGAFPGAGPAVERMREIAQRGRYA